MKYNQYYRSIAMILTFVMTSMLISPVLAAGKYEGTDKKPTAKKDLPNVKAALLESIKAKDGQTEFSSDDLEQMRAALLELVDSNEDVSTLLSPQAKERVRGNGLQKGEDQFDEIRNQIRQMSSEQLTALRKVLNPSKMRAKLATSRAALDQYKDSMIKASSKTSDSPGLPGIIASCTPLTPDAIIAADAVYFTAESVRDIAQNVCQQTVLGENTALACEISDGIYLAAKAVNVGIHFCDDDYAQSVGQASFDRLGHIHDDLAADVTDIKANDNTNTANIISNDNTNTTNIITTETTHYNALTDLINATRTAIINNANDNKDEVKNLLLRTQIEADLSSTDGSTFVALYETSSNVCFPQLNDKGVPQIAASVGAANPTQCGLLDLVRSIVSQTIINGGNDKNALKDLATGDSQRAAGQYKAAYTSYRKAYKTASK